MRLLTQFRSFIVAAVHHAILREVHGEVQVSAAASPSVGNTREGELPVAKELPPIRYLGDPTKIYLA